MNFLVSVFVSILLFHFETTTELDFPAILDHFESWSTLLLHHVLYQSKTWKLIAHRLNLNLFTNCVELSYALVTYMI